MTTKNIIVTLTLLNAGGYTFKLFGYGSTHFAEGIIALKRIQVINVSLDRSETECSKTPILGLSTK